MHKYEFNGVELRDYLLGLILIAETRKLKPEIVSCIEL